RGRVVIGMPRVAFSDHRRRSTGRLNNPAPLPNVAGERRKQEDRSAWRGGARAGENEICRRRVSDGPRRQTAGNRYGLRTGIKDKRATGLIASQKLDRAASVIIDPDWTGRGRPDTTWFDQTWY